jgi:1-deoxyxylulose-5-phosphate synthase
MQHIRLGGAGLRVSRLCLGTMTFGGQCDEARSHAILDVAAEGGIDFLDTADVYPLGGGRATAGRTEEIVGSWLKGKRQQFIVATKCAGQVGAQPWDQGMSRKHILDAIDSSLRRLGTDYVDLYQLHRYDPETPMDEALEALDTVVRQGKARYIGVSNWPAYRVARALGRGAPPPESTRFSLRSAGARYQARYWHEQEFATIESLRTVAQEAGMTMATLAVAWVLSNAAVTAPIVGASRPEQLADSLAAAEMNGLPSELKAKLDEMTHGWRAVDAER